MPELPEVETVCRGLQKSIVGLRIRDVFVRNVSLRKPMPENLASKLKKRAVKKVSRRAKYILIEMDNDQILALHLGMSGRLVVSNDISPPKKHDHIVLFLENGLTARLNDPRRFGFCDLARCSEITKRKWMQDLGIEPLSKEFSATTLLELLSKRKTNIKAALLDQKIVAGIGNIYACEALFIAGIDPRRNASSITKAEAAKLAQAIQRVLTEAIKAGGSTLRDYVQANGRAGEFQNNFSVYGREGERCKKCNSSTSKTKGISRITQNGRSTFFCAYCQK